jgi:hypothetical protein
MPTNSAADVGGNFPNPTITPIVGLPSYETIAELHLLLNQNAASVDSDLGGGQHGLLALTVSVAVYATISPIPFVAPINPGPHPIQAAGATAAQIAETNRIHDATLRIWREYQATDKALKQLLLQAVDPMYVQPLRNRLTGFAAVTTRAILDHLYTKYGRISPQDLEANDKRFKTAYDPAQPIETLFEQVSRAMDLADAAGAPYTPEQILNNAYSLVFQTGLYGDACREWRRLDVALKTWPRFQDHFMAAHEDLREAQATTLTGGYHAANAIYSDTGDPNYHQDTVDALANLAVATAADRSTIASLTTTIQQLSQALERAHGDLAQLRTAPPALPPAQKRDGTRPTNRFRYGNYCWSHGFRCGKDHTSMTCKWPKDGHQREATATNMMGGSTDK